MEKIKIFLFVFLLFEFGYSILSIAQDTAKYEKFIDQDNRFRLPTQLQKLYFSQQVSKKNNQRNLKKNPFDNYQQSKNSDFSCYPPFNPMHYFSDLRHVHKSQIPNIPCLPTGIKEDWVRTYESNTFPGYDVANGLAIDPEDNVYVTGSTTNLPQGMDFYTIKYDKNGNQVWAAYFNGEANSDDMAQTITLDDSGNVYVAGTSTGNGTGYDFVVVKYNSLGQQQWESRFDGSIHGDDYLEDAVVDNSGNVYTTGSSKSESGRELVIVKIDSDGVTQWIEQYNGPGNWDKGKAIESDSKGNVYVAGESEGTNYGNDYATIKYNAEGIQQWVRRYHRSENSNQYIETLAVDDSGNVIVLGNSFQENGSDFVTIKYSKDGDERWIVTYDGLGNEFDYDNAADLTFDKNGNVYVTGSVVHDLDNYNFATIKYNPDGIQQWIAEYDAGYGSEDAANSISVDDSGHVYVTGHSTLCEECETDYVTIKYNPQGNRVWLERYGDMDNSKDYPRAMAVNNQGEVVVTGCSKDEGTDFDYATVKYDAVGNQAWESRFNGKNRELGQGNNIKVDDWGNIYVTGGSCDEFITIKYSDLGEAEWTARLNGEQFGYGSSKSVATDQQGNVYVLGYNRLDRAELDYDFVTVKYDADGIQQWVARYV